MKHIIRKPLLPILLLVVMVFGSCFMGLFQQSILDGQQTVEEMYEHIQLTFQVLPGTSDNGVLKLRNQAVTEIRALTEVTECEYYLTCPYTVREPQYLVNLSMIYGTNDLIAFTEERSIAVEFADGWNEARLMSETADEIPCLMEINLAGVLELEAGDTFVIAPNMGDDVDSDSAPEFTMILAGTFQDQAGLTEIYSLIVSDAIFSANPGLLYNGNMMGSHYYYRMFHFKIDPTFNRAYEAVWEKIDAILEKNGDFILYSNIRILEQAIRPIEQKLRIQQSLVLPLRIVLTVAAAVITVLLSLDFFGEIFLRLLWGERRGSAFLKTLSAICVVLGCCAVCSIGSIWLVCGKLWVSWGVKCLCAVFSVCFLTAAVPLGIACSKNLVRFYQSREG